MDTLVAFLCFEIWFLLIGLMLIVIYQILTGKINTKRMLFEKNGSCSYSPGRVQLLLLTLISVFYYILEVINNPTQFPKIPQELLLILGGSNIIYLVSKAYSLFRR